MSRLRMLLLLVVTIEAVVCGGLVAGRLLRHVPTLPAPSADDPQLSMELAAVAARAADGDAADWRLLGESLIGQGMYAHAEPVLRRAIALDPREHAARFALAFVLERTGRLTDGIAEYRAFLDMPDPPREAIDRQPFAMFAIGRTHLRAGEVMAAEVAFRENRGFPPADFQLARILYFSGRHAEAAATIDRLLPQLPLALELHHLRERVMEALGRPDDAFAAAAMEERSASLVETSFNSAYVGPFTVRHGLPRLFQEYQRLEKVGDAAGMDALLTTAESLLGSRRVPQQLTVLPLQAERGLARRMPDVAIAAAAAMREAGDGSALPLLLEARARDQRGEQEAALALRLRAVEFEPTAQLHLELAEAFDRMGDAAAGKRHRALHHFHAGLDIYRRNQLPAALERLRMAADLQPDHAATWFHIGEIEYHLGSTEAADAAWRTALECRPGYGRAAEFLAGPRPAAASSSRIQGPMKEPLSR